MKTRVTSASKEVIISDDAPTVLIGERINPTGKRFLQEALKNGDMEVIRKEAREQVEAGADILDVNVGMFGVDDTKLLPQIVQIITGTVDVPVCIDSNNPDALAAAGQGTRAAGKMRRPPAQPGPGDQHVRRRLQRLVAGF